MGRLAGVILRSQDPSRLRSFYVEALGFEADDGPAGIELRAGAAPLVLRAAAGNVHPHSSAVPGWSPLFQHCALRVPDIEAAYERLCRDPRWQAISREGPERLPVRSGGVRAFKFRDPEGHPLELLELDGGADPDEALVTLDHSALSVVDLDRSIAFYERLGLIVRARSLNTGIEQVRLDDVDEARVDVITMGFPGSEPHLELLHYRDVRRPHVAHAGVDDIAATRLVFEVDDSEVLRSRTASSLETERTQVLLRDPDGHLVALVLGPSVRRDAAWAG